MAWVFTYLQREVLDYLLQQNKQSPRQYMIIYQMVRKRKYRCRALVINVVVR